MNDMERSKTWFADNRIGSGKFCECGQELTHIEYQNQRQHKYEV